MKEGVLFLMLLAAIVLVLVVFIIIQNVKDYKDYLKSYNAAIDIIEMNSEII